MKSKHFGPSLPFESLSMCFSCENNNNELHVGKNHFQMKTEKIPFQKYSHGPLQPYGNALFWDKKFWKENAARTDNFFQNTVNERKKMALFT